ncbi:MAG: GNAT family N-acetyltransferase [Geodermatophilales bacterium]|nr:GNAT family N-acetyltransferase [Geodermatophilales bacterium]
MHPGWPARLSWGPVELHPLRRRDAAEWSRVRLANEDWLRPWEPSSAVPWAIRHTPAAYRAMRAAVARRAALRSGYLGYWIDRRVAGRGMASLAVALVCDHAFGAAGLHRVQADIRPENLPSQRLVERLGFTAEGLLRRYLDIDGDWRDHRAYALLAEDLPGGVLARWRRNSPS